MFWQKQRTYLDYAAGMQGNPSSPHEEGRRMRAQLEAARVEIARLVECKADDVIFTSGATEANALAILGTCGAGIKNKELRITKPHILYLPSAHASVVENVKLAAERYGAEIEALVIKEGQVDVDALKQQMRPETVLVTMEAVCSETGTIWNTREVAHALERSRHVTSEELNWPSGRSAPSRGRASVAFHVDASQAVFTEKITRSHFGADMLVLDGGKLGAPGAGCLIAHRTLPLAPLYGGGGQERGLRSGTENVAAIKQFASALARAHDNRESFRIHTATLRTQLVENLSRLNLDIGGVYINEGREVAPHILNISLPGRDTDYLVALLDEAGFAVSTKSACESTNREGSRAVLALTNDLARAASTLRISFGSATSPRDLSRFMETLWAAICFVDTGGR